MADTATERLAELEALWLRLTAEKRVALGYRWVDTAIRTVLHDGLVQAGRPHDAAVLKVLNPIRSPTDLTVAHDTVEALSRKKGSVEVATALTSVLGGLELQKGEQDLRGRCFLALMAGRAVYGDDRVTDQMRRDLHVAGGR